MNVSNAKKNDFEEENHKDVLNNQLTTINRLQNSLPPLPPLSESVLPSSLNFPQLTLPNLPTLPDDGGSVDKKSIGNGNSNNKKKKENTGPKTRPAFVMKIWSMVNDPSNHEYIRWNDDGKTFQVFHREEFMKVILPKYFKHNNFASFVRQLNMYGWHKVQDISNGTLTRDEKNGEEIWQFKNPNFQRDREDLLDNIIRNKTTNQFEGNDLNNVNLQLILSELDQIKLNQYAIGEDLRRVRKDNKTLWQENFITRERYTQQGQTLDKILKFLAAVYGNSNKSLDGTNFEIEGLDNQMTPYQNNSNQSNQSNNSNSNPYNDYSPIPIRKPRLMLTNKAHQKTPNSDSPANSTKSESIEEIMRSHDQSPKENNLPANNLNRIYNQIVNQDNSIPSPRHYFPELNFPNSPHPNDQTPLTPDNGFSGLEQNIYKQGQSIQQVQDWIQKLASQQQEQQQMLNEQQHLKEIQNDDHSNQDIDGFDVNEFLDNHSNLQSNSNDPVVITPGLNTPKYNSSKRPIEEVYDDDNVDQPLKKR
ncbi:hypothetical protein HYPBUDRAFT_112088 [Hyphopichia burtonii NRRL Y-1933]|uniref:Heat shock transcription factor n=1 Tax=Hyphopichia burtonii NRRL Y-1933 TaxID=984485 RepID=A0A1E4RFH1_9ASCO|nr:hypothetical protein HYPBUDRAFT_112088 [Hyphopichia burtonii NRRL Y-1933]ODV65875.1 hypothetical protein HYPBUDRAFT_112088 [Hyphopichia burtonii NRRL Y-1933]